MHSDEYESFTVLSAVRTPGEMPCGFQDLGQKFRPPVEDLWFVCQASFSSIWEVGFQGIRIGGSVRSLCEGRCSLVALYTGLLR